MYNEKELKKIAEVIKDSKSMLIYPHVNPDGDALGSATAFCRAMRLSGKEAFVLIEDEIPDNLKFLDNGYCTFDSNVIENPEISLCIDCGDEGRIENRIEVFEKGEKKVCIDHHGTTKPFTEYYYIDPDAAATGEIVFSLLEILGWEVDAEIGEAIFAAITTDTGNFQYSNTTKRTHEIVTQLYDSGMNHNKVSIEIYENTDFSKIALDNLILSTVKSIADGKGMIAYVTQEMLEKAGAGMDQTEGIVGTLRSIKGVEVAAFLKEKDKEQVKVSMRAKTYADVSKISAKYNGGGHVKAAGCTINGTIEEALKIISEEIAGILK